MPHTLPALPYDFKALEPTIDATTMEIHSQRHHKTYVDNLNKALESAPDLASKDIVSLLRDIKSVPDAIRQAVINNGGGHHNHALFWEIMAPGAGGEPTGAIGDAIKAAFGDFAKFKDTFKQNALTQFGSGWSWLVYDLPEVPEQAGRLRGGVVERGELEEGRGVVHRSEGREVILRAGDMSPRFLASRNTVG
jgi:superoxide dismutase, Fe-Mn family